MDNAVATTVLLCLLFYVLANCSKEVLLLDAESANITWIVLIPGHSLLNHRLLFVVWMRPKRFKTFYFETTPVESKTFWIFVQCGRAFRGLSKGDLLLLSIQQL